MQLTRLFGEDMEKLIDQTLTPFTEAANRQGGPKEYNKLGILQAKFRQYVEAESSFRKALSRNSGYLSARINLANVQFLQDRFGDALEQFLATLGELTSAGKGETSTALKLLLNISKAYYALEDYSLAEEYYKQAAAIDADTVAEHSYLASVSAGSEEGRAAEAADNTEKILFIEEDEE
jgi:tetratricopeptide (TPR) repeat protein